jgi:hypothetical protein
VTDASAATPLAGVCATCGAPLQAGRAACVECGSPVAGPSGSPAPPAPRPDLRPPGPNEWYSDRFRTASAGGPDPAPAGGAPRPQVAGLMSDLPFEAPPWAVGWLVVSGAWVSALAYVLPWADAPGLGYFDGWGLYKTTHVLAFLAAVAIALIVILPLHLPHLIRFSLLPLLLGAFELGLFWERLGGQAIGIGLWLLLVGAVLCVSGGIVVASRLVEPPRPT